MNTKNKTCLIFSTAKINSKHQEKISPMGVTDNFENFT